jgi:TPP-dependent pyruvate/acetoin dehydrogenase alpha subunit
MAEQAITDLSKSGVIRGHHSGLGHEALGVAVGFAVRPDDCVQMSHRSGLMLAHARGGYSLREAILSQFGRAPGWMRQIPGRPRTLPIVGLVGTWVPMSVGVAMADRLRGRDSVTVTFFGDGAANEGAVHEAINLAGARRLPIVFIVENNGMAVSMPVNEATAAPDFASRAAGYGIPGVLVDGQDPLAVYEVVEAAISRARRGQGPTLIEARIVRWEAHASGIADLRTPEELTEARTRDGVRSLREDLVARGILTEREADEIDAACRREVDAAVEEGRRLGFDLRVPAPIEPADAWRLTYAG